jgi:hypothetical protein
VGLHPRGKSAVMYLNHEQPAVTSITERKHRNAKRIPLAANSPKRDERANAHVDRSFRCRS